jgi:hypothetical protein
MVIGCSVLALQVFGYKKAYVLQRGDGKHHGQQNKLGNAVVASSMLRYRSNLSEHSPCDGHDTN